MGKQEEIIKTGSIVNKEWERDKGVELESDTERLIRVVRQTLKTLFFLLISWTARVCFPVVRSVYAWSLVHHSKRKRTVRRRSQQRIDLDIAYKQLQDTHLQLRQKDDDLRASIYYAKRIQDALLKRGDGRTADLPSHFILFRPKDIVSGDFYWGTEKKIYESFPENGPGEKLISDHYWYLCVADCTGHGVPGAFMSMLGIAFLNEIVAGSKALSPATILDKLRNKVIAELNQRGYEGESQDGMDISFVRLNLKTLELQWAGANNPLWVIHYLRHQKGSSLDGESPQVSLDPALLEFKPNKQPIAYHVNQRPFTNHVLQLHKGDSFYIFSDGYADQFGGERGKKFKYRQLKNLILSVRSKTMNEQRYLLNHAFEQWKGEGDQIDDICIIGVTV